MPMREEYDRAVGSITANSKELNRSSGAIKATKLGNKKIQMKQVDEMTKNFFLQPIKLCPHAKSITYQRQLLLS